MIEWLRVSKGLCEKVATELRPDMRNQSWHSGEGCVSSIPASTNETSMSEGPKGGQCGWTKGKEGRVMDDETESGMGPAGDERSLGFILSASTGGF